jgi:citrate-Mg2+:H+ or citrate-Ca2+:H+ symporter, CitMHS family
LEGKTMLVILGFLMIAAFMYLVMSKRATPIATLILIPVIFGLFAGAGAGLSDMILKALVALAPTAALLFFTIIFFGTMIDVGLFDPLIRAILRFVRNDPVRLAVGTAMLTCVVSLDGDGSTTFIIVASALLPLYLRLGMSPVVLTTIAAIGNGLMNTMPWAGPAVRASAALHVSPIDISVPMLPAVGAGLLTLMGLAAVMGLRERKRIGKLELSETSPGLLRSPAHAAAQNGPTQQPSPAEVRSDGGASAATTLAPAHHHSSIVIEQDFTAPITADGVVERPRARPRLVWVNLAVTIATMGVMLTGVLAAPLCFMVAAALALVINFPDVREQSEQIKAHASSVISVVGMVFAAAVLTGVMSGTGMVTAMADWLVAIIPSGIGPMMAPIVGVLSIPFTFFLSNDAFFLGLLPILGETAAHHGVTGVEVARASIVGQGLHQSSPLVASFLLLIGLTDVALGDHYKKAIWRAVLVCLVVLAVGSVTAFPFFATS